MADAIDQPYEIVESVKEEDFRSLFKKLMVTTGFPDIQNRINPRNIEATGGVPAYQAALRQATVAVLHREFRDDRAAGWLEELATACREPRWRIALGAHTDDGLENPSVLDMALENVSAQHLGASSLHHLLRLVANICADSPRNQIRAVEQDVLSTLIELLALTLDTPPDEPLVDPARYIAVLYNICLDYNDPADTISTQGSPNQAQMRLTEATSIEGQFASTVLINASSIVAEEHSPALAFLIETSCKGLSSRVGTSDEDPEYRNGIVISNEYSFKEALSLLLKGPGVSIAGTDVDCYVSICNALISMLSNARGISLLLDLELLIDLISIPHQFELHSSDEPTKDDSDFDAMSQIVGCRKAFLKLVYELTSTEEFRQHLAALCVRDKVISLLQQNKNKHIDECKPFASYLMAILANGVTSVERAEMLAPQMKDVIIKTLSQTADTDLLSITLGLLGKVLLSKDAEGEYLHAGLLPQLTRVLQIQTTSQIQQECLNVFRLLLHHIPFLLTSTSSSGHLTELQSILSTILTLFNQNPDPITKCTIARLIIALCRTLGHSTSPSDFPSSPSKIFYSLFPTPGLKPTAVSTLFYLALHDPSIPAKNEAWFGLALLSTWGMRIGDVIYHVLDHAEPAVWQEMERVVEEGRMGKARGPAWENVRLFLAKLTEDLGLPGETGGDVGARLRVLAKRAFAEEGASRLNTEASEAETLRT